MSDPAPKLGVSACIFKDKRVLLAERTKPPFDGVWSLPGGHVEFGETLKAAATRELMEETGVEAELTTPFDWVEIIRPGVAHYVLAVFAGHWRAGVAVASGDARAVTWAAPDDIGMLALTPGTEKIIAKAFRLIAKR